MKKLLVIIIFLFCLGLVHADNTTVGLNWLDNNINWDSASIEEMSFTLSAFNANSVSTGVGLIKLNEKKDSTGCFPSGNCNSKDTALAALALYNLGEEITEQLEWLNSSLTSANVQGEWIIQVVTSDNGNCTFDYDNTEGTFEIDGVENSWIYINGQSPTLQIDFNEPVEYVNVDCDLSGSTIVSLLRKDGNNFYITQEESGNDVTIEINNACYSASGGSSCSVDSSFYASWALKRIGEDISTLPYLESEADNNLYYAMLAYIEGGEKNLDVLLENQNVKWDDTYTTAFAVDALENTNYDDNRTVALDWLLEQQISSGSGEGSWNGNVKDTSVVLYLALFEDSGFITPGFGTDYCGNAVKDIGEECDPGGSSGPADDSLCPGECTIDCECSEDGGDDGCSSNLDCNPNEYCDISSGECKEAVYCSGNFDCNFDEFCDNDGICKATSADCSSDNDCLIGEYCDVFENECKDSCGNNICESSLGEDDFTCASDCGSVDDGYCGDNVCDSDEDKDSCPSDCEEKSSLWWVWLIIIVVVLGVSGYFGIMYFGKPKAAVSKSPSFLGPQKPSAPSYPQKPVQRVSGRDTAIERELDRSLKEARELLKKK